MNPSTATEAWKSPPSTTCEACDNLVDEEKVPDVADSTFSSNSSKKRKRDKQPNKKNKTKKRKKNKTKSSKQKGQDLESENDVQLHLQDQYSTMNDDKSSNSNPILEDHTTTTTSNMSTVTTQEHQEEEEEEEEEEETDWDFTEVMTEEEKEVTWDLTKVMTEEDLSKEELQKCETEGCNLASACVYTGNSSEKLKYNCCLDCQKVAFNGWPQSLAEIPLKNMSPKHKFLLKSKCSKFKKVAMPKFDKPQIATEKDMRSCVRNIYETTALDACRERMLQDFPEARTVLTTEQLFSMAKHYALEKDTLSIREATGAQACFSEWVRETDKGIYISQTGDVPSKNHRQMQIWHYPPQKDCNLEAIRLDPDEKLPSNYVQCALCRHSPDNPSVRNFTRTMPSHMFKETRKCDGVSETDRKAKQEDIAKTICAMDIIPFVAPYYQPLRTWMIKNLLCIKGITQEELDFLVCCFALIKAKAIAGNNKIPCIVFGNPANEFVKANLEVLERGFTLHIGNPHAQQWMMGMSGKPRIVDWFKKNEERMIQVDKSTHQAFSIAYAKEIQDGSLTMVPVEEANFYSGVCNVEMDPAAYELWKEQKRLYSEYMSKLKKEWWDKMSEKEREEQVEKMKAGKANMSQEKKNRMKENMSAAQVKLWKTKSEKEREEQVEKMKAGKANMSQEKKNRMKENMSAAQVKVWKNMSHEDYQQRKQKNPSTGTKDNGRLQEKEEWKQKVKDGMANMSVEKKRTRKEKMSAAQVKVWKTKGKLSWDQMLELCVEWMLNNKEEGHMILPKGYTQYSSPSYASYGLQNLGSWVNRNYNRERDKLRKGLEAKGIEVDKVRLAGCSYSRYAFPSDE